MVDSIGFKGGTASVEPRALASVTPAQAPKPVANEATDTRAADTTTQAGQVSRDLAAVPPVDADRVAQIRKAISDGRFPLVTSTIADRLLALKMEWKRGDDAA